jgi:diacylglycerol kinase family enzyme
MIILLNKYANGTGGLHKWGKLKTGLEEKHLGRDYSLITSFKTFRRDIGRDLESGERRFVAAGGDGTVNFLLNQMMALDAKLRSQLILGAIGLGSSNDFHKDFNGNSNGRSTGNGKVPVKLDFKKAVPHNVGLIDYKDVHNQWQSKYFIVNCSIGLVAQANYFFNSEDKIVNWLKPKWVEGTIWYSALETLFTAKNIPVRMRVGNEDIETELTTCSVFINPNVSGDFRYDIKISPQSDFLGVALCERMGILSRVRTLLAMAKGRFVGMPKTRAWRATEVEITSPVPIALEMDGEVSLARQLRIKLLRRALRVCQ